MPIGTDEAVSPLSSGELNIADGERYSDIERKHRQITQFLKASRYDAALLQCPTNFAWFTAGGLIPQVGPQECSAALLITNEARVVVCNNVDSGNLFERELPGLGFLLKERPWHEPKTVLIDDICRGRKVASDTGYGDTTDESARLSQFRLPLDTSECSRMRDLGAMVSHAVEATARTMDIQQTEAEVAGQVAHRLLRHEVQPQKIQVLADGRGDLHRHWTYSGAPVRHWCTIAAVGTRWGLSCAATRTVCFGNPPDELSKTFQQVAMLEATGLYFSQPGTPLGEAWERVRRIYEKVEHGSEWQRCQQGEVIGYRVCEVPVVPRSDLRIVPGLALHWHPSINGVMMGDTVLVGEERNEILTPTDNWPRVAVSVRGDVISVPDILCREPGHENSVLL